MVATLAKPKTKTPKPKRGAKPAAVDAALHAWLSAYYAELRKGGRGLAHLGRLLGYADGTQVSKYLSKKPEGRVDLMEEAIRQHRDRMAVARRFGQAADSGEFFSTSVARQVEAFLKIVHAADDCAIIHGPAGIGKTRALEHFAAKGGERVRLITLDAAHRGAKQVQGAVWRGTSKRAYKVNTPRWDYLTERYRESGTLFLFDNAQRLNRDGRYWIFYFHDATGCAQVMCGNPSIMSDVASVDQHFSRTFQVAAPKLLRPLDAVRKLVAQYLPQHTGDADLEAMCAYVASGPGRLRTLVKALKAVPPFMTLDSYKGDAKAAFVAARGTSVHA